MDDKNVNENMLAISEEAKEEGKDIKSVKYLKDLSIIPQTDKYTGWQEDEIYLVEKESAGEDGESIITYEIYNSENQLIATTNEKGEIIFEEEYLKSLQQIIDEKFGGLIAYEDLGLEAADREIYLEKILEGREEDLIELEEDLEIEEIGEDEEEPEIEQFTVEELEKRGNGWDEYVNAIKIKETDPIYKDLPGLEKPAYIAYDKKGNFKVITPGEDGSPKQSEIVESSRSTMEPVIHIDSTGEPIETMVPTAVMNTNDSDLKISVKIGQYGYIDAQKLQRAHDNRYIATNIDKAGGKEKEFDVRYQTDETKQGNNFAEEMADNYESREEEEDSTIELHEIDVNIEAIKREIADEALENYNDMSSGELREFIRAELTKKLGEEDSHINEFTDDIKETVEDESRFPQRGEKT